MDTLKFLLPCSLAIFWLHQTFAAPADGAHKVPTKGIDQLNAFWNSLTPEQQQLIKNHNSRGSLIQKLLAQSKPQAVNKRDFEEHPQISPELQNYYKNLSPQEQELIRKHPSQAFHLITALLDAQNAVEEEESAVGKRQLDIGVDNSDWSVILKDMLTHINALKEITRKAAEHQGNSITIDDLTNKILEDVKLAKEKGIKLEDLLKSLNMQGGSMQKIDHYLVEDD